MIRYKDGRRDIESLRERYASATAAQGIINRAKTDLSNLRYKNERNYSFEKFSSRLQKIYDNLEIQERDVNNRNIVNALWKRIQHVEIQQYIASLKIDY